VWLANGRELPCQDDETMAEVVRSDLKFVDGYDLSIEPANIWLELKALREMHGPSPGVCQGWRFQGAGFARARRCRPLSACELSGNS
jgi:hypothetical protein